MPYTLKALVDQNLSTQVINLNPYLVTSWVGNLVLTPDSDNWVEIVNLPDVINNVTNTVTIVRDIPGGDGTRQTGNTGFVNSDPGGSDQFGGAGFGFGGVDASSTGDLGFGGGSLGGMATEGGGAPW